ncbi:MAG: hypothetical protein QGH41_04030, partial [Roseibacillus sp.]|nr:hypothetical protein [Roseibacillus sp.]
WKGVETITVGTGPSYARSDQVNYQTAQPITGDYGIGKMANTSTATTKITTPGEISLGQHELEAGNHENLSVFQLKSIGSQPN